MNTSGWLSIVIFLCFFSYMYVTLTCAAALIDKKSPRVHWQNVMASGINSVLAVLFVMLHIRIPLFYILLAVLLYSELLLMCRYSKEFAYWAALHITLHILCMRGVVTPLYAFAAHTSACRVILNPAENARTLVVSLAVLLLIMIILIRCHLKVRIVRLLKYKRQVRFVYTVATVIFIYELFCAEIFYYRVELLMFTLFHMLGCALLLMGYYLILDRAVKSSVWMDEVVKAYILEERLDKQILHYQSYHKYLESIRAFRHDYDKIISSVRFYIRLDNKQKVKELLEQADHHLQEDIKCHRPYSNHMLIDAMMQELANECENLGLGLEANIFLPEWMQFSYFELCRIINFITDQALESCRYAKNEMTKKISISSGENQDWFTLLADYTCNGPLAITNVSRKQNIYMEDLYRVESSYVEELIESRGGFIQLDFEEAVKSCRLSLHFSRPVI